ncbi:MAG TPA: DUF4956 domain-containing protein [Bacteroidetes bacterium]|nr:hypothetical protein BMS3Bbin04_01077 [bacterium BMS3Bbin04]HDO66127.1 DUF4956 domain-containing protein [Bacteroidota bacterium]HEX05252.1 DUF4956 domain-containing protein [Bacteroidota bacterium]
MNEFLTSFQTVSHPQTVEYIVVNLLIACVLSMLIVGVYRMTNRHRATNKSFILALVIMSMVVALVMMVIGNSVARAFSLVGALSIIRFRTVVKDNRDIAFIFFALATGMAAGTGSYLLAIFGSGTIMVILLILDFASFGQPRSGLYLLRFQYVTSDTDASSFAPLFKDLVKHSRRVSVKTVRMGQFVEHTYLIRLKKNVSEEKLIRGLSALEGMERVSLLSEDDEVEI